LPIFDWRLPNEKAISPQQSAQGKWLLVDARRN